MANETRGGIDDSLVWDEKLEGSNPLLGIDERPGTTWESVLYGWQHTLVDITPLVFPFVVAAAIGLSGRQAADLVNATLFAMGIATLLQTTIGNRLPIIQGPSVTVGGTIMSVGAIFGLPALWGAIFFGAVAEMLLGLSKILRYARKLLPLSVSGVVVICIGVSLGMTASGWMIGDGSAENFILAATVVLCILVLQILLRNRWNGILARGSIFFSIWIVGLGVAGVMGRVNWSLIAERPWFAVPRLFPYGMPGFGWTFVWGAVAGILAGYLGSMVESIGDYAATCAVANEQFRVRHMNRGIFSEGLGCVVASIFGALPVTSYTQNIGVIATTRIASRYVVQLAAVILMLYGLSPKFGALLAAIPQPVLGAVFVIICGSIVVSGMRLLRSAADTDGNKLLVGTALILAIGVPVYARANLGSWLQTVPPFIRLLMTNNVIIALLAGVALNVLVNHVLARTARAEA